MSKFRSFMLFLFCLTSLNLFCEPSMHDFLVQYHNSVEKKNEGYTKLLYALSKNYRNIAISLLKTEDPNAKPKWYLMTPFMLAVIKEDDELVFKMLDKCANPNLECIFNDKLKSPLWVAVQNNKDVKIIKLLCEHGAIIIEKSKFFWDYTGSLSNAVEKTDFKKFRTMADYLSTCDLALLDHYKTNIFGVPMAKGNMNEKDYVDNSIKIAEYLIKKGVSIETENGRSALSSAVIVGNIPLMNLLLENGANVDFGTNKNFNSLYSNVNPILTSLYYCNHAEKINNLENIEPLEIILKYNANINFSSYHYHTFGFSPLGYAINSNLLQAVDLLISYGADVNLLEISGKTPLIRAVEKDNIVIVKKLLDAGADPTKKGKGNHPNPIDIASSKGYFEILNLLIEAESNLY